mmetsp:Transcript_107336/g.308913  ORF Transcript_107336/g.308913 Transcript_107336/m.308913 type:complete len:203 (+) Transcript_107336:1016-1624(+)
MGSLEEAAKALGVSRGGPLRGSSTEARAIAAALALSASASACDSACCCLAWFCLACFDHVPSSADSKALYNVLTLRRKRFCSCAGREPCQTVSFCRSSFNNPDKNSCRCAAWPLTRAAGPAAPLPPPAPRPEPSNLPVNGGSAGVDADLCGLPPTSIFAVAVAPPPSIAAPRKCAREPTAPPRVATMEGARRGHAGLSQNCA